MQEYLGYILAGATLMNVQSLKAQLRNYAIRTNHTFQDVLILYGIERMVYRISISKYVENFTLKGGIFLYALYDKNFARSTADVDLLAHHTSNDIESMRSIFGEIIACEADDGLNFDAKTLEFQIISQVKAYHGVRVSVRAYLDRTRIPISLDIGFGDVVYPERVQLGFPTILGTDEPVIFAYSIESVIAEKFEAIVQLGYANSRYKDFYDIYILSKTQNIDGVVLQNAIAETFRQRRTSFQDIVAFTTEYMNDPVRISRWNAFIKIKKALIPVGFPESVEKIKEFLLPVVKAIQCDENFHSIWSSEEGAWHLDDLV
ncbi:nucleotidyl transferase AbiEii/AbiGii toxin family protein [uncultured Sphaerochaeta sp.]|uniref:nucleotidyl transferase AbiEii/AbiGii toxin family protein n=1 Tax=uncultured Sphaerochaeta sp. TaxID=886478 RepID=UPI0029CA02EF|nr:nucleotidyl transferase AbiEii/AbiGii toxin family protein [uncultured Sphaerochaeta sp.]